MDSDTPPSSDSNKAPDASPTRGLAAFWAELKRRKVTRVAITYAVAAWLIIQIAVSTFPSLYIPQWALSLVIMCVILGFPVALIVTWAFELTPDGIKTTKAAKAARADAPVSEAQQRKRNWFSVVFAAAVPTVIFGALALFFYFRSPSSPAPSTASPELAESEKSIAVLPLINMSPDEENAFFADGVQEDILTKLSRLEDLRVISRTSTLRFRGTTTKSLGDIGRELGVRFLVEGSVRRAGNAVRVTVQLIDAQTDEHIWAESYDRSLDNIFAIQTAIATEIAQQLKAALTTEELERIARPPTENLAAYDLYVKHRQLTERTTREWATKIDLLEKAVALDPEFAEAWSYLAIERIQMWRVEKRRNDPELLSKAYHALEQAKRFGPDLPELRHAQAFVANGVDRDLEAAIKLRLEALEIDPGFIYAKRVLGGNYASLGRLREAQHYREAVLSADPLSLRSNYELFSTYQTARNWEKARALIQANLEREDDRDYWQGLLAQLDFLQFGDRDVYLSGSKRRSGFAENPYSKAKVSLVERDYTAALQSFEEWDSSSAVDFIIGPSLYIEPTDLARALIHFELGDTTSWPVEAKSAQSYLEGITEQDPKAWPHYWSQMVICHALQGDRERMESAIASAREKSSGSDMKYYYQALCECHIAIAYLVLGDNEKAIETLEITSTMESPLFLNRELDLWFIFDRLRGDPRFDKLLE